MKYLENSLFVKERYQSELEKIKDLEEMYKSNYKKTALKDSPFTSGIEKTIKDKKDTMFINFLMLKVIEEMLYQDKAVQSCLHLQSSIMLKMNIYEDKIIFNNMMRIKDSYVSYPDFRFRKTHLLEDLVYFAKAIIPESAQREKMIDNIKSDFSFIEKLKIESKLENLNSSNNEIKPRRV